MKRKIIIVVLICIISGFTVYKSYEMRDSNFIIFDSEKWEKYPSKRHLMIEDFERKYPIEELTKDKVLDLLGDEIMSDTGNMFSYYTGNGLIYIKYYGITFDDRGNCITRYSYDD